MGSEHSVVTALAELGRLEQERVEGERRQAARQRVSALEQELARRAAERFERELEQARARLQTEHEAAAQSLRDQLVAMQVKLAAAEAGRDTLRSALAAQAQPQVQPRAGRIAPALLLALAGALAALAFGQQLRLHALEQQRPPPAPARTAPVRAPDPQLPAAASAATPVLPQRASGASVPPGKGAHKPAGSAHGAGKIMQDRRAAGAAARDPLAGLDGCPEDDPTCGLDVAD